MEEPQVPIDYPSTTPSFLDTNLTGRPLPRRTVRRRRADPLGGARLYGPETPVSVTLTIRRGADMWLEVRAPNGRFFTDPDCSVYALMQQIIRGGHWVRDEPSTTTRRRRARASDR